MGRGSGSCCSEEGLNRGAWTAQEDRLLSSYIVAHGEGKWTHVPQRAGLNRSGKSCRLRWLNYLRPDIKRGNITQDEQELIIRLHKLLGNRWSLIAGRLPGRTDNEIKNYWNTTLAKKLRPQSCSMSEQHPSSKLTENQPEVSGPQVIKTRATRCKSLVILDPTCPKEKENSLASNQRGFNEVHLTTQFKNGTQCSHSPKARGVDEYHNSDVDILSCRSVEFQEDAADFCRDFNLDSSMGMVMDGQAHADQSLPIDKLMVNCWTTSESLDVNATMDLDSLALLLDSGNWP